jgi:hypothetical protein
MDLMKSVVIVHKFSLARDKIADILKENNIIVFEVGNSLDLFKILEVMIPNLIITIIDLKIDKITAYEIYNNLLDHPRTLKIPMLFYNSIDRECFIYWKRAESSEKETYIFKNCQSKQVLETIHKIFRIQSKKLQTLT